MADTVVFLVRIEQHFTRDGHRRAERQHCHGDSPNLYLPGATKEETIQTLRRLGFQNVPFVLDESCAKTPDTALPRGRHSGGL